MHFTGKLLLAIVAQWGATSALANSYAGCESISCFTNLTEGGGYRIPGPAGESGESVLASNMDNGSGPTINPTLAAFFYHRGNTYYFLDEFPHAISNYDEAISLRPNYAEAYYFRGLAYYRNGAFERALADFRTALSKNSFSISASELNTDARQKILEVELKISEIADPQTP
jgi:tetratricopeptide (TPR) repeat protein